MKYNYFKKINLIKVINFFMIILLFIIVYKYYFKLIEGKGLKGLVKKGTDAGNKIGGTINDGIGNIGGTINDGIGNVGGTINDGIGNVGGIVGDGITDTIDIIGNTFDNLEIQNTLFKLIEPVENLKANVLSLVEVLKEF